MIVDERVDRHQLDCRDAEPPQVLEHGRGGERGILAAQLLRYVGVVDRQALDVQLVDDGLVPGRVGPPVVAPGECRIDDLALGHAERAVAIVGREILAPAADAITEMRVAPAQRARDRTGVRIEQQLFRIEAHTGLRIVGPVNAIAVKQPRSCVRQVTMPDLIGLLAQRNALDLAAAFRVEQAQLDTFGVLGKQPEVHAFPVPGRAQRVRPARPDRYERLHRTRAGRTAHASPARWVATCGAPRIVCRIDSRACDVTALISSDRALPTYPRRYGVTNAR